MKDKKKPIKALMIAVRILLAAWLILKLADIAIMIMSVGAFGLVSVLPGQELGFRSLFFSDSSTLGLVVFIGYIVLMTIGLPISFLVLSGKRPQRITGFIAYSLITLFDIVSAIILGPKDSDFLLSLCLSLLIAVCLAVYLKWFLIDPAKADHDGEEAENIS